jgi:DNA-binding beta-propeller fold protein YncE
VLNKFGNLVQTLAAPFKLNGPWDMTVVSTRGSGALVFISNVLSGTVWRLKVATRKTGFQPIQITSAVMIGSGFPDGVSPSGLVAGPGGLAYNPKNQTLYVVSQLDNSIYAIPTAGSTLHNEGRGKLIVHDPANLHGPMGLVLAPNGNLIVANSDTVNLNPTQPSELVEYTPKGAFVGSFSVDPNTGGAFGLAISPPSLSIAPNTRTLAAVDDNFPNRLGTTPVLEEYTFPS